MSDKLKDYVMKIWQSLFVLCCVGSTGLFEVAAQETTASGPNQKEFEENADLNRGFLSAPIPGRGFAFEFSGSQNGGNVIFELGHSLDSFKIGTRGRTEIYGARRVELEVSVPVGQMQSIENITTLNELGSGFTAEASYSIGRLFVDFEDITPDEQEKRRLEGLAIAQDNCEKEKTPIKCTEEKNKSDTQFIFDHAEEFYRDNFIVKSAPSIWFTGSATLGVDQFDFVRIEDLTEQSDREFEYGFELEATYIPTSGQNSFTLGAGFQSAFEENDEEIICRPGTPMSPENCLNGRAGPPTRENSFLAHVEYRHIFDISGFNIAIAPRVTVNFNSDEVGVIAPIYFTPESDVRFSTGLQVGWESESDDVMVGFFVSAPFRL